MPQQLDSMVSTFSSGTSRSTCSTGLNAPNDFWWQWPCSKALPAMEPSGRRRRPASASRTRNSSNNNACALTPFAAYVRAQRQQLVAKRQQAARLEANDGNATQGERRVGCDQPVELGAGVVDQAR